MIIILKLIEITICLFIGLSIFYLSDYHSNHLEDDDYFKKNHKVLIRGIICKFIMGVVAFVIINEVKIPEPLNRVGTIFIGLNGPAILEKIAHNSSAFSSSSKKVE